ncbi:MAG: hypothetical protein GY838_14835 [bacterium]|nr:hypothetical protein [bacterium]
MTIMRQSWIRRGGIAGAVLLLVVLIASLALHLYGRVRFARAEAGFEAEVGSLDFAHVESPQLPDEENAATWLVAGAAAIVLSNDDRQLIHDAVNTAHAEWDREQEETLRALVERNRGGLETLHQAASCEQSDYGIVLPDGRVSVRVPDLLRLLAAAKLLHVEARLAFADEDIARGLVVTQTLSRLSTSLTGEHTVIAPLVGNAVETWLDGVVAEVVGSAAAWAAKPTLLAELEAMLPRDDPLATTRRFLIEAAWVESSVVRLGWRLGDGDEPRSGIYRYLFGNLAGAEILEAVRRQVELVGVPYGSAPERFDPGPSPLQSHKRHAHVVTPFSKAVAKFQSTASQRQLIRAAIALRRMGIARGSYPRERPSIAELDEPDAFTGRLMVYGPRDDGSLWLEFEGAAELDRSLRERPIMPVFAVVLPPPFTGESQ